MGSRSLISRWRERRRLERGRCTRCGYQWNGVRCSECGHEAPAPAPSHDDAGWVLRVTVRVRRDRGDGTPPAETSRTVTTIIR